MEALPDDWIETGLDDEVLGHANSLPQQLSAVSDEDVSIIYSHTYSVKELHSQIRLVASFMSICRGPSQDRAIFQFTNYSLL